MISVIQLVGNASVKVDSKIVGAIQKGILALIGFEKSDTEKTAEKLILKTINYRIFPDANGKTNLSLVDISGGLLLVPQFTLMADTAKGLRPGFSKGMPPQDGQRLFEYTKEFALKQNLEVAAGQFGANMQVSLCNEGPMTFLFQI